MQSNGIHRSSTPLLYAVTLRRYSHRYSSLLLYTHPIWQHWRCQMAVKECRASPVVPCAAAAPMPCSRGVAGQPLSPSTPLHPGGGGGGAWRQVPKPPQQVWSTRHTHNPDSNQPRSEQVGHRAPYPLQTPPPWHCPLGRKSIALGRPGFHLRGGVGTRRRSNRMHHSAAQHKLEQHRAA